MATDIAQFIKHWAEIEVIMSLEGSVAEDLYIFTCKIINPVP